MLLAIVQIAFNGCQLLTGEHFGAEGFQVQKLAEIRDELLLRLADAHVLRLWIESVQPFLHHRRVKRRVGVGSTGC